MSEDVATYRLHLMRALYLANFVGLGFQVWPGLIKHEGWANPLEGVAVSFWAALSILAGFGLRYPLKMVPLLLLQMFYKAIWLVGVLLPVWSVGQSTDPSGKEMMIGVVLDFLVIPWTYVLTNYVMKRGDRWR